MAMKRGLRQGSALTRFATREQGGTAVIATLALTALIGAAALVVDLGRFYNLDTELQNAADAAALAGATQLDNAAGARARATTAATGTLAQNAQTFATDGAGTDVNVTAPDIRFLVDLTTRAVATTDEEANFIEVTVAQRTVTYGLGQVLGQNSASPDAVAAAGMGSAFCQVPPLMFCTPPAGIGSLNPGEGIQLKESNGGGWVPGNFGLLGLDDGGGVSLSTDLVRDALGRTDPVAQCFGANDSVQSKPGQATAVAMGINMRFDIYPQGSLGGPPFPSEPSDFADNPHYLPAMNTVKGLIRTGSKCSMGNPQGWNHPTEQFDGPGDTTVDAMGFPRDNCAYPFDAANNPTGGQCDPNLGNTQFGTGDWDVDTYMGVNHGYSDGIADGQLSAPPPGLTNDPTRWELYQWELSSSMPGTHPLATTVEDPNPVCSTVPGPFNPDRRVITAVAVDCTGLNGTETLDSCATSGPPCIEGFYQLFLTEPMGAHDGNNDIYAEFIGPALNAGFNTQVARHVVQLYE